MADEGSLSAWRHCREVAIEGRGDLAGCQVRLELQGADPSAPGYLRFDEAATGGRDVLLVDGDGGTRLPFWIQQWDDRARAAVIWLRAPTVPGRALMLWGNPGAPCRSCGEETFEFFEDFETSLLEVQRTRIDLGGEPAALCGEGADHIDVWYTGPGNRIHHARSTDGVAFESRHTDLPEGLLRCTVLEEGGLYYLYGAARDQSIHLYTSRDGVHFEARGVALAGGQRRDRYVANSFVWVEDGVWHMLYEAGHDEGPSRWDICLATAATPTGFSNGRHPGNPVLVAPGGGCGNPELARIGSRVLRDRGRYWLFYHRGENWRAHSEDLRTWTQEGVAWGYDRTDPVGYSCGDASVCQFRGRTYLWKSVSDQVSQCWMSVAIADMPLREYLATAVPMSAARWEDTSPDGGYPRYPDIDTTLARTGRSSVFLKKPYWRQPRGVAMGHRCQPDGPVVVSAWLHDGGPGLPGEAHVGIRDGAGGRQVRAGIDTAVSATHYVVACEGPAVASPLARTRGWHEVAFAVQAWGTQVRIDGACAGRGGAVRASTMGWVTFGSRREMPADVSLDSVTIRRHAEPVPVAVLESGP